MRKQDNAKKLSKIFAAIQDAALMTHEEFEAKSIVPLFDFERCLIDSRRFSAELRSGIIWQLLIFSQARALSQKQFQDALTTRLNSTEQAFVMRQLISRAPHAWSCRKFGKDRGFAHSLAGPMKNTEVSVNGCISASGTPIDDEHLFLIGWTLTFNDEIFLVSAGTISQEIARNIENIHPFPVQNSDDDFWEENALSMIACLENPGPTIFDTQAMVRRTSYRPEFRFYLIQKIILSSFFPPSVRTLPLPEFAAVHKPEEICSKAKDLANIYAPHDMQKDIQIRILEAVGCDANGEMPHAHTALLASDPVALLGLPDEHPCLKEVHPRDPIRLALKTNNPDAAAAFEIYQRERRWLAAFPAFDLSLDAHAAAFGIPVGSVERLFPPRLFTARLPIVPQDNILRILQNKYRLFLPDADPPTFRSVLDVLVSRNFMRNELMASAVQWVLSCCDRYRYCLSSIVPDSGTARRCISDTNQSLLKKGLSGLADMFK